MWFSIAKVTGSGHFPYDMLRYDRCSPSGQEDVMEMTRSSIHKTTVQVIRYGSSKPDAEHWTAARWASFGWTLQVAETRRM